MLNRFWRKPPGKSDKLYRRGGGGEKSSEPAYVINVIKTNQNFQTHYMQFIVDSLDIIIMWFEWV